MAYIGMTFIVMAYIVMVHIVMAYGCRPVGAVVMLREFFKEVEIHARGAGVMLASRRSRVRADAPDTAYVTVN